MGLFEFSDEDLKRSEMLDPGKWYRFLLKEFEELTSKKDQSINNTYTCVVIGSGEKGEELPEKFLGVPVMVFLNEKDSARWGAVPFFKAFGVQLKKGVSYNVGAFKGRTVQARVEHRLVDGKMQNNIVDWRPDGEASSEAGEATQKEAY
jgi:hypothetical protein